ncbi:MAG TPA: SusC/RagA family TonB-linked outer membrane protein [Balneolales bacterium]|nr:SusC/RagA family TonB-linked outer membrane protein [Balneolales bacterium]
MFRKLLYVTLISLLVPLSAVLAQSGSISGKVTDGKTGEVLPGANVFISQIQKGASTNPDGKYVIKNIPAGTYTLTASYIGYQKYITTVDIGTKEVVLNIKLQPDMLGLEEVVVTAFGIKRKERSLGYSVQNVKGADVDRSKESNVVNALEGKVAGVEINSSSGQPGASSRIVIRGNSSMLGNNQPLFVVDGIPISNAEDANQAGDALFVGSASNRGLDLDPNTIASISVLKGASATALYGSRASNGVILITTKGAENAKQQQTKITLNSRVGWDNAIIDGYQTTYLQGQNGYYQNGMTGADAYVQPGAVSVGGAPITVSQTTLSWGPNKNNVDPQVLQDLGVSQIKTYDPRKQFYKTGVVTDNNFGISGGTNAGNYYLSMTNLNQNGIVPGTQLNRRSFLAKFNSQLTKKLNVETSATYTRTKNNWMAEGNGNRAYTYSLNAAPISFNMANYENADGSQNMYTSAFNNPYWLVNNNGYDSKVDRIIGNTKAQYEITPWMNLSERLGIDTYSDTRKGETNIGTRSYPDGSMYDQKLNRTEINSDLVLQINKDFTKDISFSALVGNNINTRSYGSQVQVGNGLNIPNFFNISNASSVTASEYASDVRLVSVYSQVTLGYKDYTYLTLTARNDWSSTLPKKNNSYFYPSASLGFVFTDALGIKDNPILSFGKLRLSVAQIGNDAPVYSLTTNYIQANPGDGVRGNISYPYEGVNGYLLSNVLGNPTLKPEITTSYEGGLDLRFFKGRARIDASYYNRTTKNQIFQVPVSPATGYVNKLANAGEIRNSGIELSLSGTPVQTRGFSWDVVANFSKNTTDVLSLADGVESIYLAGFTSPQIRIMPGKNGYGIIWGSRYQRNDQGQLLIDDSGYPILAADLGPIGNVQPDWLANFRTTFSYKNFTLSGLINVRQGGKILNMDKYYTIYYGTAAETANRGTEYVWPGVNENTGEANTTAITRDELYYRGFYTNSFENLVEDGGFVKLKELSLSYSLPRKLLEKTPFEGITITGTGRNLWINTRFSYGDPEGNLLGSGNGQGFYHDVTPNTRSYSLSIRVNI